MQQPLPERQCGMSERIFLPAELYGIIGHPLGHTMSPLVHNWGFQRLGLPKVYMRWPVAPDAVGSFMDMVRELPISGLSVTIPHKRAVMASLDGMSDRARRIGAVNTLYWRNGELLGENTDVTGFTAPIEMLGSKLDSVLVLGAGGAARGVVCGLKDIGVEEIVVTARNRTKADTFARELGLSVCEWEDRSNREADLLVNTTPLGMAGKWAEASPMPTGARFAKYRAVYDLVYNPPATRLLAEARQDGCTVISGVAMFVHQAADQFRLWTGQELPIEPATLLVHQALQ